MNFQIHSHRFGLEITENNNHLNQLWKEISNEIYSISDDELINEFESKGLNRGKSMSVAFNNLLKKK